MFQLEKVSVVGVHQGVSEDVKVHERVATNLSVLSVERYFIILI